MKDVARINLNMLVCTFSLLASDVCEGGSKLALLLDEVSDFVAFTRKEKLLSRLQKSLG